MKVIVSLVIAVLALIITHNVVSYHIAHRLITGTQCKVIISGEFTERGAKNAAISGVTWADAWYDGDIHLNYMTLLTPSTAVHEAAHCWDEHGYIPVNGNDYYTAPVSPDSSYDLYCTWWSGEQIVPRNEWLRL